MRELIAALGLAIIIEGLLFAFSPSRLREALKLLNQLPDKTLRLSGGLAVALGFLILALSRSNFGLN